MNVFKIKHVLALSFLIAIAMLFLNIAPKNIVYAGPWLCSNMVTGQEVYCANGCTAVCTSGHCTDTCDGDEDCSCTSSCKSSGQSCYGSPGSSTYCCSGLNCVNYTCVGGGGPSGGTTTTSCNPISKATACGSRVCGSVKESRCGVTYNCGTCQIPSGCNSSGQCVCDVGLNGTACADAGRSCGTWTQAGCTFSCGSCTDTNTTCSYSDPTAGTCVCKPMTVSCGRCSTDATHLGYWATWNETSSACDRTSCYGAVTYTGPDLRCPTTNCTSPNSNPHFECQSNTCVSVASCSTNSGGCTSAGGSCGTTDTTTPTTTTPPSGCSGGTSSSVCTANTDCCSCTCGSPPVGGGPRHCTGSTTSPKYPSCVSTPPSVSYNITGRVFIDTNQNGAKDTGESYWPKDSATKQGAAVNLSGNRTRSDSTGSGGDYGFSSLPAGSYTVTLVVPTGYRTTTTNPRSVTLGPSSTVNFGVISASISPTPTSIPTPTLTPPNIQGYVFIDSNRNRIMNAGEVGVQNQQIRIRRRFAAAAVYTYLTTDSNGFYRFNNTIPGTNYTVRHNSTLPVGYSRTTAQDVTTTAINGTIVINFGIVPDPTPSYTTTGYIFVDKNNNGLKEGTDECYSGPISVRIQPVKTGTETITAPEAIVPFTSSNANSNCNTYSISHTNQCATFTLTDLPSGYKITGANYKDNTHTSLTSSIANTIYVCGSEVNFGINNSTPWIQTECGDFGINSGVKNPIPANPVCGSSSGAYASLACSVGSGIVFSGDSDPNLGTTGLPSINEWLVGDATFPDLFNPAVSKKTSTAYLLSKAAQMGLTTTDLNTVPGCSDYTSCTLPANLVSGVYIVNGENVTLNLTGGGYTFPPGNYVFIIKGDLNINEKIIVPNGSTAIFSAYKITVNRTVGESEFCPAGDPPSDIEGWYSADGDFIADGTNNCATATDLRLNIAGSVVTGAAGTGLLINNRDLCAGNINSPSLYIKARPDFILNAPSVIKTSTYTWQEVAP